MIFSGLVLILLGTSITVLTLVGEWRTHRSGEPLVPWPARLRTWWRKLLHKPGARLRVYGISADGAALVQPVTDAVDALPVDSDASALALARRLDAITTEMRQQSEHAAYTHRLAEARLSRLGSDVEALRTSVRDVATGSVRWELVGIALVGLGTILSAIPSL